MKKIFIIAGLFLMFMTTVAFAKMPREEMYIGGVGAGVSLGYVKQVYGEPADIKRFNGEGIRAVTFVYSDTFSITGRTGSRDNRPEEDLIVVGFTCTDPYLATKGGIRVGMSYENDVVRKYGSGRAFTNRDGELMYIYDGGRGMQFCFYVDDDGDTIRKIYQGTEW